jgi:phosphatidylglycerol:prolipoprotein diacylglycerol transferase
MIPYFALYQIPIGGGLSLAAFGTLVAAGVILAALFAESRARVAGIPERELYRAIAWALVPGFLLAHAVALLLGGREIDWSPRVVFEFWNGMSSFGGFAGAFLGLAFYYRRARRPWLALADVLVAGLVVGWVFGRLGCTLVHDHIGRPSDFWLAIDFPEGPRHDLGFYEFLYTLVVLLPAAILLTRVRRMPGTTVAVIALLYAPARFLGDFLRNSDLPGADPRYGGLTLAQYACLGLAAVGVAIATRIRRPG